VEHGDQLLEVETKTPRRLLKKKMNRGVAEIRREREPEEAS
jgi:hypothetical protein